MLRGRNVGKLLDVTSFITEMVRFNEFRPSLFLYCLRKLRLLHSLESAQVIALLMERCGPVLLFVDQVRPSINYELDRLHDMCRNNIVDSDSAAVLMNAYYACRPQERPKVIRTQLPPQQRYLRHLLTDVLSPRDVDASCQRVTEKLLKNLRVSDLEEVKDKLIDIADDGKITDDEKPELKNILSYLDDLAKTLSELRTIGEKVLGRDLHDER